MVKIISYDERVAEDGRVFFSLTVQGGIEMIKSKKSEGFYATARKASIPSTFDEDTCKALVGTDMEGRIVKQQCEPYEYTIKETGEVIELSYRYVYVPEEVTQNQVNLEKNKIKNTSFSSNGVLSQ